MKPFDGMGGDVDPNDPDKFLLSCGCSIKAQIEPEALLFGLHACEPEHEPLLQEFFETVFLTVGAQVGSLAIAILQGLGFPIPFVEPQPQRPDPRNN